MPAPSFPILNALQTWYQLPLVVCAKGTAISIPTIRYIHLRIITAFLHVVHFYSLIEAESVFLAQDSVRLAPSPPTHSHI